MYILDHQQSALQLGRPHLHEGRVDVVDLHEEGDVMDGKGAILRQGTDDLHRMLVAHGNTAVELDVLDAWDWERSNHLLGNWDLERTRVTALAADHTLSGSNYS